MVTKKEVHPQKAKRLKPDSMNLQSATTPTSPHKKVVQYYSHTDFRKSSENSVCKDILKCPCFFTSVATINIENSNTVDLNAQIQIENHQHIDMHLNFRIVNDIACTYCRDFYMSFVHANQTVCEQIQKRIAKHYEDANSKVIWTDCRKLRITASTASKCPKKKTTDPSRYLREHVNSSFKGNFATRHGSSNEHIARQIFEDVTKQTVTLTGIFICEDDQWLSAKPNGILDEEWVLEIKCPLSEDLHDLFKSNKYDVHIDENGLEYLHSAGKNGYYTQVQLTLHCTKREKCIFVVYAAGKKNVKIF